MIIVKLQGGLGNQMFQYAFAKSLSIKSGIPFALDAIALNNGEGITRRKYSLDIFSISPLLLDRNNSRIFRESNKYVNESAIPSFEDTILLTKEEKDPYFDGYWQNEKYFKNNS